jgi:DNA-binding MarR family transcriptional regulator
LRGLDVGDAFVVPLPSYLSYLLYQTEQHRRALATDCIAKHGLTFPKWVAMIALARFGDCSMTRLARLAATDRTTLTRSIDGLIRDALVVRAASPGDRRIVVVRLTQAGSDLLVRISQDIQPRHAELYADLTDEERTNMTRYLQKMVAGLIEEPEWQQDVLAFSRKAEAATV